MSASPSTLCLLGVALVCLATVGAQHIGAGTAHCNNCDRNAACQPRGSNTFGQTIYECVCNPNFQGNGLTCTSTAGPITGNTCIPGQATCSPDAKCLPAGSSFQCVCNPGFSGNGRTCTDTNECANPNACDPATSEFCINSAGSFECLCKVGFTHPTAVNGVPDQAKCVDEDECRTNPCQPNSVCTNTPGSYICSCVKGYVLSPDGRACIDSNECLNPGSFTCPPNSQCVNTVGSYSCSCNPGYQQVSGGGACVDVNECLSGNVCDPVTSTCSNLPGDFQCACKPGYAHTTGGNKQCSDINECLNPNSFTCQPNSQCVNNVGSYACACVSGFQNSPTGSGCVDVDECKTNSKTCNQYATCTNTVGGYSCACFYGYQGDGQTCTEVSPPLSQVIANITDLDDTLLNLQIQMAYFKNSQLRSDLERVKRLCPLKKAGLPPFSAVGKRAVADDIKNLVTGDAATRQSKLQTLQNLNGSLQAQINQLKANCGVNFYH